MQHPCSARFIELLLCSLAGHVNVKMVVNKIPLHTRSEIMRTVD